MPEFTYKALDASKRYATGQLQAASVNAAMDQLRELGYVPLLAVPRVEQNDVTWRRFLPRASVNDREVTILLRDVALLLRSGLPLDEGLRLLAGNASTAMAQLIHQLRKVIGAGGHFAEALQSHPATASPDVIAIVKSAEAAGNLEHALRVLTAEREKQERLASKISSAVRYPLFLLVVSVAVLVFFLTFVVPQFADVVRDLGGKTNVTVQTVLWISDGLRNNMYAIGAVVTAVVVLCITASRVPRIRDEFYRLAGRLPGIRGVLMLRRTTKFCRGLGMLLSNGVTLTDALRLLSESQAGARELKMVSDHVRRGGRFADSVSETRFLPPLAARMLRVGEETGSLDQVAASCADYYESKLAEQVEKLSGIAGPAAIVFISGVIGTLIVTIMSTLLSINQMAM
jgi:general secretion pathway protein F